MRGKAALVLCFAAVAIWTSDILDDEFHDETTSHQLEAGLKEEQEVPMSHPGFLRRLSLPGNAQLAKEMVAKSGRRKVQDTPVHARVLSSGYTPLHEAAENGDVSKVKELLAKGAEVDAKNKYDWQTLLHTAAKYGHLNVVKELLTKGAEVDAKDKYGNTPLHEAAEHGHLDVVKELIAKGAEVDAKDEDGETPLHQAALKGHLDVVQALLAKGAEVNDKENYFGSTPLHNAAKYGHVDVVKELLAKGAEVDAKDLFGYRPLQEAAKDGHLDVVQELLAKGAQVNAKTTKGSTPLHGAAKHGHLDVVKELLAKGAEVNAENLDGKTPLHNAAFFGHLDVVKELLAKGAEVNAKNLDGQTPLHHAAKYGHVDVVKELLANRAQLDAKNEDGYTPLHLASSEGHLDVVQALVIKLAERAKKSKESSEALKTLTDALQERCLPEVAQWAVKNSYAIDDFPGDASMARSCVLQYMSFEARERLALGSKWSYVFPGAGVAIAAVSVYLVEPMIDAPDHKETHKFNHGAHSLVARATIKCYWPKVAFRLVEVMSIIGFFIGFAMVELWWVLWLPFVGLLFLLPGIKLKELIRAPVKCIASTNTREGYMWSFLRLLLIFGAYKGVEASTGWRRRKASPWDFLSLKMELFVNPMYEGLRNKMKVMWPEATLAPLLDRITYFATLGSKNSINEIDFPWIDGQVKCLAHINAFQISELGKSVLFLSLLVYAGSLLLRMLHQCCKDSDILDINYASHAKELAECPTEDVPDLIKKIKQEEPHLQVERIGKFSLIKMLIFVALDVFFDVNTIITLILSSNLRFACALTFVVARSAFREWNNFSGLIKAVCESYERGMLHEQLIDLLEEEKGAEAFFSLSITSYSYVYCVQTADQAMTQWCSILLAAYGIAEFLVQKMEFPTTQKVNSFVIVPSEESQKEKGDA